MRLRVVRAARRDLREIDAYTCGKWGEGQSQRYASLIDRRLDLIAAEPELGTSLGPRRPDLNRWRAGEHFIIYRLMGTEVVVLRVLHVRSDYFRRLPKTRA